MTLHSLLPQGHLLAWRLAGALVLVCGCSGVNTNPTQPDAPPDMALEIDAPTVLTVHHYVVDKQVIPLTNSQARDLGLDLDDDAVIDNQLGAVMATFAAQGFETQTPVDTAVDRGSILMLIDLGSNGFTNSEARFTLYSGANPQPAPCTSGADTICRHHLDGTGSFAVAATSAHDTPLAGNLAAGVLVTNVDSSGRLQIQTTLLTTNPVTLNLIGARAKVTGLSDPGISNGVIAGAVTQTEVDGTLMPAWQQAFDATVQQACPGAPPSCGCAGGSQGQTMQQLFDTTPKDCTISLAEVKNNSLIQSLVAPDVMIDGQQALSLGFGFTAVKAVFTP